MERVYGWDACVSCSAWKGICLIEIHSACRKNLNSLSLCPPWHKLYCYVTVPIRVVTEAFLARFYDTQFLWDRFQIKDKSRREVLSSEMTVIICWNISYTKKNITSERKSSNPPAWKWKSFHTGRFTILTLTIDIIPRSILQLTVA